MSNSLHSIRVWHAPRKESLLKRDMKNKNFFNQARRSLPNVVLEPDFTHVMWN
jgi:hypothetical protein